MSRTLEEAQRALVEIRADLSALDLLLERLVLIIAVQETDGTSPAVAKRLGLTTFCARGIAERHGVELAPGRGGGVTDRATYEARNAEIVRRVRAGEVRAQIGREYGLSGTRISAIYNAAEDDRWFEDRLPKEEP